MGTMISQSRHSAVGRDASCCKKAAPRPTAKVTAAALHGDDPTGKMQPQSYLT